MIIRIEEGDIFDYPTDAICIPINGNIFRCNPNLMGACLTTATEIFPDVIKNLEKVTRLSPNYVSLLSSTKRTKLLSFPVKPMEVLGEQDIGTKIVRRMEDKFTKEKGREIPPWVVRPSLALIEISAYQVRNYASNNRLETIVLPKICKRELDWEKEVKPILSEILDDRFILLY